MMTITMKFPSPSTCRECEKWLRFLGNGQYGKPDDLSLMVNVRSEFRFGMLLDVLSRHVPPIDWERTEITGEGEWEL